MGNRWVPEEDNKSNYKFLQIERCKSPDTREEFRRTARNSVFNIRRSVIFSVQAWTGPEVSMRLRFPDCMKISTLRWYECQPYAPVAFTLQEISLILISDTG